MNAEQERLLKKQAAVSDFLAGERRAAIAFSAGVDSTLLLDLARETLGENALAVTAVSVLTPEREQREAAAFCRERGIRLLRVPFDPFAVPGFRENPPDRCYLCKKALFLSLRTAAEKEGFGTLLDGTNADDLRSDRPGLRAIEELGVKSPLAEAGMTKTEIRALSALRGLPTAGKPALACLATRVPAGETVTTEKLMRIDRAEALLFAMGFSQVRVRCHGDLARIELKPEELPRLLAPETARKAAEAVRAAGFRYVAADLEGYRAK